MSRFVTALLLTTSMMLLCAENAEAWPKMERIIDQEGELGRVGVYTMTYSRDRFYIAEPGPKLVEVDELQWFKHMYGKGPKYDDSPPEAEIRVVRVDNNSYLVDLDADRAARMELRSDDFDMDVPLDERTAEIVLHSASGDFDLSQDPVWAAWWEARLANPLSWPYWIIYALLALVFLLTVRLLLRQAR